MASKRKNLTVRLRPHESDWLEMLKAIHGVSFAAAIRIGIRAVAERLGLAKK